MPTYEIFGTTNDALREAAVKKEKRKMKNEKKKVFFLGRKKRKLFVLLWCRGQIRYFCII